MGRKYLPDFGILSFGLLLVSFTSVILYYKNYSSLLESSSTEIPVSTNPFHVSTTTTTENQVTKRIFSASTVEKLKPGVLFPSGGSCEGRVYTPTVHAVYPHESTPNTTNEISKCKSNVSFMTMTDDARLVFESSAKMPPNLTCCLHEMQTTEETKQTKTGGGSTITTKKSIPVCTEITSPETKNGQNVVLVEDFPHVSCEWDSGNGMRKKNELYLSNLQLTEASQVKTDFWKALSKVPNFKMPRSVLIIGLSSISSNQALTHLPSTHRVLLKSGFTRYNNYVQSGIGILENFYPILTGQTLESCLTRVNRTVRNGCENLRSKYNDLNYVTFNGIQDDVYGTFFKQDPDYTLVPLLKSYESGMMDEAAEEEPNVCFQLNLITEILSYTSEFLVNFDDVPYFGTLWLDSYAHQNQIGLEVADDLLSSFLQYNKPNNTLLIVVSDGGLSELESASTNGILENHFPAMYVRLPKSTSRTVHATSRKGLISHKQLYATLLKNLDLSCKEMLKETVAGNLNESRYPVTKVCKEVESEVKETSIVALWDPLPTSKRNNCNSAGIVPKYCFCSAHLAPETGMVSNEIVEIGAHFVLNFINDFIDASFSPGNRVACVHWVLEAEGILFNSTVLVTTPGDTVKTRMETPTQHTELFLILRVQPFDVTESLGQVQTQFSARIRFGSSPSDDSSGMTLADFPIRIPGKGEFPKTYSKCVSNLPNHQLQSICYCKPPQLNMGHIIDIPGY